MSVIKGWTRRARAVLQGSRLDREMNEEVAFHLEMETNKNIRAGMNPAEARRRAALTFGGVEKFKQEVRESRRLAWVDSLVFDLKLGLRMLVKYPGLTLVSGLGMAVAIAIAALSFGVIHAFADPALPLPAGDRIVSIQNWDARLGEPNRRSLHDFAIWRERLTTVQELGAARLFMQNLVDRGGQSEPVRVAEITASGFQVVRTPPLLGRYLAAHDEEQGARSVAVIGFDVWQRRFNGNPDVVGSSVRLGGDLYTVVGVMPEGFGFPVNQNIWTPFRGQASNVEAGAGPEIHVFGRLAPGMTFAQAEAEIVALGAALRAQSGDAGADLRPQVLPYTYPFLDLNTADAGRWLKILQGFVILLLIYVCVNVAILVYARTAARTTEFAVRTALGGSRRRVILQLLFEALVLSSAAGLVGMAIAAAALDQANSLELGTDGLPFWMEFGLSAGTVVYVTWLSILAATIVGVVPALKMTGRHIESTLRAIGSRSTGMQLGRWWTALIVGQVAMAVTILPVAAFTFRETSRHALAKPGFAVDEYLAAPLHLDAIARGAAPGPNDHARYVTLQAEVLRRLAAEPWVAEALVTDTVPGQALPDLVSLERIVGPETSAGNTEPPGEVGVNRVGRGFFDLFDVPFLMGRDFDAGDLASTARVVIVNRSFLRDVAGGGNVLGQRLRVRSAAVEAVNAGREEWYEIVGVVEDLQYPDSDVPPAAIYFPLAAEHAYPTSVIVHTRGSAPAFAANRLRTIATTLDPALRFGDIATLDDARQQDQRIWRVVSLGIAFLTASVLLLSAAGIYALMSFTVTKQRREIGLRAALGARPDRLLWNIFFQSGRQLLVGVLIGLAIAGAIEWASGGQILRGQGIVLVPAAGAFMAAVGLLAAAGPARRALRIQPTEALREL
jgi:putative ABC transport system permease protein